MSGRIERSIDELYQDDSERADAIVFGRKTAMLFIVAPRVTVSS